MVATRPQIQFYFARTLAQSNPIDCSTTPQGPTDTLLIIRMKSRFVIDRNLFTRIDVSQGYEQNVIVKDLHEGVWRARVVNVMRPVPTTTAIETPASIDLANPQSLAM